MCIAVSYNPVSCAGQTPNTTLDKVHCVIVTGLHLVSTGCTCEGGTLLFSIMWIVTVTTVLNTVCSPELQHHSRNHRPKLQKPLLLSLCYSPHVNQQLHISTTTSQQPQPHVCFTSPSEITFDRACCLGNVVLNRWAGPELEAVTVGRSETGHSSHTEAGIYSRRRDQSQNNFTQAKPDKTEY